MVFCWFAISWAKSDPRAPQRRAQLADVFRSLDRQTRSASRTIPRPRDGDAIPLSAREQVCGASIGLCRPFLIAGAAFCSWQRVSDWDWTSKRSIIPALNRPWTEHHEEGEQIPQPATLYPNSARRILEPIDHSIFCTLVHRRPPINYTASVSIGGSWLNPWAPKR